VLPVRTTEQTTPETSASQPEGATTMNDRPAPPQPHPAARATPRTPRISRTLAAFGGLAVLLAAAIGLAPAAWATLPPPEPSVAPLPPPPPAALPAHFPPWAIAAILAATIILSVATTLITLALEHTHRVRRETAATPEPQPSTPALLARPASYAGPAEILSSHPARDRA
jgi:hypothetical protein